MSAVIDPIIEDRLSRYLRRQRRWVWLRALLVALAVWIIAILVVTWIDGAWVIERGTRSLLTLTAYGVAAVVFVRLAVVRRSEPERLRQAALALENARPELRDRLLSAVELAAAAQRESLAGSRAFIQAAQREMARKIIRVNVRELLPVRLLLKPLLVTAVLLAGAASLVLFPELHYGSRYARAIIPGIDLDRVSRTRIVILRPDPASRVVPAGELTAVAIETHGRPATTAELQWESADGQRGTLPMNPLDERYDTGRGAATDNRADRAPVPLAVNLPIQHAPVRYRVLAGDGVTAWHQLQPQPRPSAIEFEKELLPPPYARLPSVVESSADGALQGLRGSTVRLNVRFDMPVVDAVVRLLGEDQRIPMSGAGESWTATIVLESDDRYQVLARSEATGFDNGLSPQYPITVLTDQPPQVSWLEHDGSGFSSGDTAAGGQAEPARRGSRGAPAEQRRLVTSQSTLSLGAQVVDEMPIERLFQETALNGGPWTLTPRDESLPSDPAAKLSLTWSWDVTTVASEQAPLRPGDLIRTRMVAIDRNGQRGSSEIRHYLISDQTWDARRRANLQAWSDLARQFADWQTAVRGELVRLEIAELPGEPAADQPAAGDATAAGNPSGEPVAAVPLGEQTKTLLDRLAAMTRTALHDTEAGELELLGRSVSRIGASLASAAAASDPETRKSFSSLGAVVRQVAETARYATAHRLAVTLADDFDRMLLAMQPLVSEEAAIEWESFGRYHQVTQQQFRDIQELIAAMQATIPDSTRNHNDQLRRWIDGWLERLAASSSPDVGEQRVRSTTHDLVSDLQSRRRIAMLDGRLPSLLVDAHQRLHAFAGWHAPELAAAQQLALAIRQVSGGDGDSEQAKQASALQQQLTQQLARIAAQLDRDAELNLRRSEADRRYVADARMLRRVLEIIAAPEFAPPAERSLDQVLEELTLAFHQLEAGHWWAQTLAELRTLADVERWDIDSANARLDAPMRWERVQRGLDQALDGLEKSKIAWELRRAAHETRHDPQTARIGQAMTSRRWQPVAAVSLADDLDAKHAALVAAGRELEPALADARRRIAAYLPNLAEMARGAADRLRAAEQIAKQQQKQAPQAAAEQLRQQQQQAQQQADKLHEALADEAITQDLTTHDGLRKARDADIAARAIEQQMQTASEATASAAQQAQQAADTAAAEAALQSAAQPLAEAAETLERIAQHYERTQAADAREPSAAPASLADLEQKLGLQEELDEKFARSKTLAETLNSDPRELLKKLSDELKRNQRMRQELSEIATQAIQDAQRSLAQQAQREHQLRQDLERLDPRRLSQKQELEETIRTAVDSAAAVQRAMLHAAKQSTARLGNLPEELAEQAQQIQQQLAAASQQLQAAADAATATRPAEQELLAELRQRAQQLHDELEQAVQTLEHSEQLLRLLREDPAVALTDDRQRAEQRDMQNLQRQTRDTLAGAARSHQNRLSQAATGAEEQAQRVRRQLQQAQEQLQAAEKRLEQRPDDEQLQHQRDRAAVRVERENQRLTHAQADLQRRRQALEQARGRLAEIARTPLTPMESNRPAAELAELMQQRARTQLQQEQAALAATLTAAEQPPALRAEAEPLAAGQRVQQEVQGEVQRAAENLQRAARHQERIGDADGAELLASSAAAVQSIAEQEVAEASAAIAQAAEQAAAAEVAAADAELPAQTLGAAEQAIAAQAAALQQVLGGPAGEGATRDRQAGDPRAAAAQQMARTLDELDRSLNQSRSNRQDNPPAEGAQPADEPGEGEPNNESGQPNEQPGEGQAPGEGQGQPGASSPTLEAEARRQMQQLALQRMLPGEGQPGEGQAGTSPGQPQAGQPGEDQSAESGPGSRGRDAAAFQLPEIAAEQDGDWGRLRVLQSEDTSVQRRVEVSPEFRQQIQAYFRAIAERAQADAGQGRAVPVPPTDN